MQSENQKTFYVFQREVIQYRGLVKPAWDKLRRPAEDSDETQMWDVWEAAIISIFRGLLKKALDLGKVKAALGSSH